MSTNMKILHNNKKRHTSEPNKNPPKKFHLKLSTKIKLFILILAVILNIAAWNSTAFSDWYIAHIMPILVNTYSRFTSLFPISVGEILIILGIFLLVLCIIIIFLLLLPFKKLKKFCRGYLNVISYIVVFVILIQTLGCFIQYHASTFEEQYLDTSKVYGPDELNSLRENIVGNLNELSTKFERDENGEIIYDKDMYAECIKSMQKLGETYPNLAGYYPRPKKILASDFMSQQYLAGIYFPFTLEANYNTTMYIANMPYTICHELAHLKGYIYEDEANFIAFMACMQSDDDFFKYSGYINVLGYVSKDFRKIADETLWENRTLITETVAEDDVFLKQAAWDKVNKKAIFKTETVETISNKMLDGNLKINGIKDGMASYSRVVRLLLSYYY